MGKAKRIRLLFGRGGGGGAGAGGVRPGMVRYGTVR